MLRLCFLVILACVGSFLPSRACARVAETRTEVFLLQLQNSRPESEPQVADLHLANPGCGYELASGSSQAAEGGTAASTRWVFQAGTPDAVIDEATQRAIATLDRYSPDFEFSPTDSVHDRMGWTRFDEARSVTLFPNSDVLTLIEEAHHVETAVANDFWGDPIEFAAQKVARQNLLESEWEAYAESIGAVKK